ncbi:MAG TPA: glycosyltransferase family 2 protein, partial [Steroidobacteraceae bacterium]|nr:glycosyltransferase family 2 protein [Steroidobacteraceae bacterium]
QLALFSRRWNPKQIDLMYVLDDVRWRRNAQTLAQSAYERFGIPFRLVLLPSPVGPGPAFNAGLRAARGQYVCFMRPEVLPVNEQWLERLLDRLERHANVGLLSARLLSEDGSIRHEGYRYRPMREFGNWQYPDHLNEGRRPEPKIGLHRCDAVAHGCMLMRRSLALKLGGFDESYLAGEFEDSDLCLKVRARELTCAVDDEVELYQLQSPRHSASTDPRSINLTLYNAWVHQRRWFSASARTLAVAP